MQRLLFEQSPDAMALCSDDGRVLLWNPGAEELFGYTADEALGRRWDELVVPPGAAREEQGRRERARDGNVTARAVLRRRQDGTLLHADSALRAVFGSDRRLQGYAICERDVTALTISRDTRLVEERFRDLLESVPDAMVIVNEIGRIVLFNGQCERLFGFVRAEIVGQPIETLLPARFHAAHVAHRLRFLERPAVRQMGAGLALFGRRRDGAEFPVQISLSPLAVGDVHYVMSAIRDISAEKRFEQALQEKNIELTVANQAKDRFLATMSHELRTPLNAIIGFSGLLLMQRAGELNDEQRRQLAIVRQSGEQLLALIEQLLALAQLQSGAAPPAPEPLDLAALLRVMGPRLAPLAEHAGCMLATALPATAAPIEADRPSVERLVRTLAAQALREGSGAELVLAVRLVDAEVQLTLGRGSELDAPPAPCGGARPDGSGLAHELAARLAERAGARLACRRGGPGSALYTLSWPAS
ncbi:PAS domain S-box-containing protein [Rubrivivax gelatinosus]|uniref:sensor histidine kinase n=2 Tax=Rubrivivax gelatinosus TaxID=28068 RepID=UPI0018C9EF49|nr:PAS domain S-box protein [Rubrivivax gelatinosus]MBG6080440.1 PAS domain S-box-containing protein [Rubrivivax gelatinosus]